MVKLAKEERAKEKYEKSRQAEKKTDILAIQGKKLKHAGAIYGHFRNLFSCI